MPEEERQRTVVAGAAMARRPPAPMIPQRIGGAPHDDPEVEQLASWLTAVMTKGRLTALGLGSRSAVDASLSPISSWDQEDFDKHNTPDDLAAVIMAAAYRDAASQRGTTRYVVNAYRDEERTHFQKYSFRLDGGMEFTDKDEVNYPANESGVLAMTMKHLEFFTRMFSQGQAETNRILNQQVVELHRQNNKLAAQQYKVLDLQQQMYDRGAERALAVSEQEAKEKRKQMVFEKFLVLWPILAKRFFGGKDKGTDAILAEEQLGTLLESFDEDQIRQLVPMFSDEQRIAFFTVYQEYKMRKKRLSDPEEEAQAPAPEPAPQAYAEPPPEPFPEPQAGPSPEPAPVEAAPEPQAQPQPDGAAVATPEGAIAEVAPSPPAAVPTSAEVLVLALGEEFLNDEKVGRLAEIIDSAVRPAFLAAVQAKRDRLALGV